MIVCAMPAWAITHVSANVDAILGLGLPQTLLGKAVDDVLPGKLVHDLRNTLQAAMVSNTAEILPDVVVASDGSRFDVAVHMNDQNVLFEFLPREGAQAPSSAPLALVRSMLSRLKKAPTLERGLVLSANQIRAVTGFDRVMIYQFLEDGSGRVVAEALRSGLTPFLGLRYPQSDIPAQAREIYKKHWVRAIPDVDYVASPIVADQNGLAPQALDLSLATLRSVSPIHVEYLKNMGSRATLTISLVTGDTLWGLIACHHEAPRRLAVSTGSACEFFGQILSLQIEAKEQERELSYIAKSREAHERLIASMPPEETLFDDLERYTELLKELVPCDGIGIWTAGVFSGVGVLPPVEAMPALVAFLGRHNAQEIFSTDTLDQVFPAAGPYRGNVSGLIAVPFSRAPRDYLFFFRREILQIVTWGGNPDKAVDTKLDGRIGPRKSFEAWREEVRGHSVPWRPVECKIAEALRVSLLDVILRRVDLVERERRSAQESQALLIAELNHRVKNILALIRSLVRQSRQGATSIGTFTADLEQRIKALALAHDQMTLSGWSAAPLRQLLHAEAEVWTRSARTLVFEGPDVLLDSRAYQTLALVVHELMTNAAKYGALSTPHGALSVQWSLGEAGELRLDWHETGGPPVQAPTRRGFGTVVVEQTVPFELQGEASVDYVLEGVRAHFVVPAVHVSLGSPTTHVSLKPLRGDDRIDLRGKRVLLVEDSMMIALDAQSAMQDENIGVEIVGTVSDALRAVQLGRFDAAILDINLSGETSFGIADGCETRNLPFVFATGYGESVVIPDRFRDVPVVSKPYDLQSIWMALGHALTWSEQKAAERATAVAN